MRKRLPRKLNKRLNIPLDGTWLLVLFSRWYSIEMPAYDRIQAARIQSRWKVSGNIRVRNSFPKTESVSARILRNWGWRDLSKDFIRSKVWKFVLQTNLGSAVYRGEATLHNIMPVHMSAYRSSENLFLFQFVPRKILKLCRLIYVQAFYSHLSL